MATKEQIELNKKKQQFLNLNGIKVKVDGSWGPWQQKQYEKLTTKNKHYQTTPLGFLSQLYDRTLGEGTTYQEDPAFVSGYSGEIKQDNRSNARRYLDSQMKNNKTPLGYITQTVLPAAAVSSTIVYGGPALVQGVKTAVTNPSTVLSALKTFGKETVKGIAGATAVNVASEVTTGKTWGEQVAQSTGVSSGLGEFTNPGFALGHLTYNLVSQGPKYIFDHLPYKTIYNTNRAVNNLTKDAKVFFNTPLSQNPIHTVKRQQQRKTTKKAIEIDAEPIGTYNVHKKSIINSDDEIPQIRQRLAARMSKGDNLYSYYNEGTPATPNDVISNIPTKEYLTFREAYDMLPDPENTLDKFANAIITPKAWWQFNTNPAFGFDNNGRRMIKINRKAIKDFNLDLSTTLSHEYNHMLKNGSVGADGNLQRFSAFNYDHLPRGTKGYLSTPTEIEARGTQLKNYFDTDVITPDMLKYAAKNYVKDTKIDNNMNQFFSGIKDWNQAAQYLSKYSLKNGGKL